MREGGKAQGWVRAAVDYGAPLGFFVGYVVTRDLVQATAVLVAVSAVSLALGLIVERRIAPLPLLAGGLALVFGGLTLAFDDPRFIKAKPTVVNALLAAALAVGLVTRRNPLRAVMGSTVSLPDATWRTLTIRYLFFFLLMAVANETVWRSLDAVKAAGGTLIGRDPDDLFVLWRFPGLQLAALAFTLTQLPLLSRGMRNVASDAEGG